MHAPVGLAVDVACGTGLSSLALLAIAERVIATDVSQAMLAQAPEDARISYRQAPAEALPLEAESADLITVSSAFHWFVREAFLREARRVLRPGGWLVVYENFFEGRRHPNLAFVRWLEGYYEAHPAPPRDRAPFTDDDAEEAGFDFCERVTYENTWSFALGALSAICSRRATRSPRWSAVRVRRKGCAGGLPNSWSLFSGVAKRPFCSPVLSGF